MTKKQMEEFGIDSNVIEDRLVERLFESVWETDGGDSELGPIQSQFAGRLEKAVTEKVDQAIAETMAKQVEPKVVQMVDDIVLQTTNKWGESRGEPVTFIEYLVQRVDHYIRERVNYEGKAEEESRYNWRGNQTRIAYLIHEHLQYSIKAAMEKALGEVNSSVRKGLEEAVNEALKSIKVKVDTKVST